MNNISSDFYFEFKSDDIINYILIKEIDDNAKITVYWYYNP